jgi:hypothetical protein
MPTLFRRIIDLFRPATVSVRPLLTSDKVIEIAKHEIEPTGLWRPEVRVGARLDEDDSSRVVWDVVTNVPNRGAHARVLVDDATGTVIKRWLVSR